MKIKATAVRVKDHGARISKNLEQLVEATALTTISLFSAYQSRFGNLHPYFRYVLGVSALIVLIRAILLFVKHLDKE